MGSRPEAKRLQPNLKTHKLLLLIAIACLLVVADQVSKAIVRTTLRPGDSVPLVGGVLKITLVQNFSGFSWWMPPMPEWTKLALLAALLFVVLMAFPLYLFHVHTRRQSIWADIAVVGISAACLGHLTDTFFVPYTTDFIQVFHLPSANFADLYSYVGGGALITETILWVRAGKLERK